MVSFDDNMHHVATFSGHCKSKQLSKTFELKDNVKIQQTLEYTEKKKKTLIKQFALTLVLEHNESISRKPQHVHKSDNSNGKKKYSLATSLHLLLICKKCTNILGKLQFTSLEDGVKQ